MKRDYPELEGEEVYVVNSGGRGALGIVTGCNLDIGISIQEKGNLGHYLACSQGPSSPLWRKHWEFTKTDKIIFYNMVAQIKRGYFYVNRIEEIIIKHSSDRQNYVLSKQPSAKTCAYAQ